MLEPITRSDQLADAGVWRTVEIISGKGGRLRGGRVLFSPAKEPEAKGQGFRIPVRISESCSLIRIKSGLKACKELK